MEALRVSLISVTNVLRITPRMVRVTFGGDHLADLSIDAPGQKVYLCFPKPGQTVPHLPESGADGGVMAWFHAFQAIPEHERPWMRSFTIRAYHPERNSIDFDFVLHGDNGPASMWGASARIGETLGMVGPTPDYSQPIGTSDWLLMAGDETALPAIGTIIESLPEGARTIAYIEVSDAAEEQRFKTRGEVSVHWMHRDEATTGRSERLLEAVRAARFPPGSMFAWLAGEAGTVRALRRHLVNDRGVDKHSIDFTGYWRLKLTQDDGPTEEDAAEIQERMANG